MIIKIKKKIRSILQMKILYTDIMSSKKKYKSSQESNSNTCIKIASNKNFFQNHDSQFFPN